MRCCGQDGQAAVEAVAGAGILLALGVALAHLFAVLATAGVLQAETREAAVREAQTESGVTRVVRSREVGGPIFGGRGIRLTARAATRDPSQ